MVTISEKIDVSTYLHRDKPFWNAVAIIYTFMGYLGGITLLILPGIGLNVLGVILLTHSLLISAYLSHELMHGSIFKKRHLNVTFGKVMLWFNGGCYYGFETLTLLHIAHHVDRADIITFDIPQAIQKQPHILQQIILALEWLYFPVTAFWSRWQWIISPWRNLERRKERLRTVIILAIRGGMFAILGLISPKALLLYFLSYVGMITVLRWMDAFQHTYEGFPPGTKLPRRNRAHEQINTFSNLFSQRYSWLNLLLLNFGYHNAHHTVMKCPWHSLHELNKELMKHDNIRYVSLREQFINYHRFRITRLIKGQGEAIDNNGNFTFEKFYGAIDVSFLTIY